MKSSPVLAVLCLAFASATAADMEAGRAKVASVCAACHGANGVSVSEGIPNLAGQRAGYISAQLEAFKQGTRKNDMMNAIAPQLSASDIADVAAYFASLPGAAVGARSPLLPNIAKTHVTLPANLDQGFVRYLVKNEPQALQVSMYYANPEAVRAAAAGRPLPDGSGVYIAQYAAKLDANHKPLVGTDGKFVADKLLSYTGMASGEGWGRDIPEILRNGNWNYGVFAADGTARTANQATCLACHKPREGTSFLFLHAELASSAGQVQKQQ
jgi:cytochrome c553